MTEKAESDRCFERATKLLIAAFRSCGRAIALHNLRSLAHAWCALGVLGSPPAIWSCRCCVASAMSFRM